MLLSVYGASMLCCLQLFEWIEWFWEGRESIFDDAREGWPKTACVCVLLSSKSSPKFTKNSGELCEMLLAVSVCVTKACVRFWSKNCTCRRCHRILFQRCTELNKSQVTWWKTLLKIPSTIDKRWWWTMYWLYSQAGVLNKCLKKKYYLCGSGLLDIEGEIECLMECTKTSDETVKAHPHLYVNANKACRTEGNANECQKVACSAFAAQANEQVFRWSFVGCSNEYTSISVWLWTYFSLKYGLQTDSVCLFAKHIPHKRIGSSTETVEFQVYEILKINHEFFQFFWLR